MDRFIWRSRERCLRRIVATMNGQMLDVDTAIDRALHFVDSVGHTFCIRPEMISAVAKDKLRSDALTIYKKTKTFVSDWKPIPVWKLHGKTGPARGVPAGK